MAKGNSGRLVIEIDPSIKKELYDALGQKGLNMKEWFLMNAEVYLRKNSLTSVPKIKANREDGL